MLPGGLHHHVMDHRICADYDRYGEEEPYVVLVEDFYALVHEVAVGHFSGQGTEVISDRKKYGAPYPRTEHGEEREGGMLHA